MRTFKPLNLLTACAIVLPLLSGTAFALDASKIIKKDTKSSTIFELFFDFLDKGKPDDALDVLKYAAEQGNSAAQWKLARLYERGEQGVDTDHLAAFRMYQRIAANYPYARPNTPAWQFSADALVALGNYYRKGIPDTLVFADAGKAQMMYTTAAMVFRHPGAQFELGRMQIQNDKGFGQGRIGVRNLGLAYEKGHVGAEALLGYAIFEGVHAKRNVVRGLVMLGNAKRRASTRDLEWIAPLHDEAFALARPDERAAASQKLIESSTSLQ
ncbi:MAG: sel1 repeat family protein [Pseudomonadota bacterium]